MDDSRHLRTTAERVIAEARVLCDAAAEARERARLVIEINHARRARLDLERQGAFGIDVDHTSAPGTTLHVRGELDLATGPQLNESLLAQLADDQVDALRIDLAAVTFISIGALRDLFGVVHQAQRGGCEVSVVNESSAVLGLLGRVSWFDPRDRRRPRPRRRLGR